MIGRGGASTVHAATDLLLGRPVAIKIFTARAESPDALRLQEAEARLLGRLNHYALTTLLDAGIEASDPDRPRIFLVMERVPGLDLRERLRLGPLLASQVAALGSEIAEALHYVHEQGYLHRDLKPANILLLEDRPDRRIRAKLADFGISTIIGAHDGRNTTGTAAYIAPEIAEGRDAEPASDVYSLGLVLLEAATGRVAFPGSVAESLQTRLERDPVVPADLPAALADEFRRMLAREPGARPPLPQIAIDLQNAFLAELVRARTLDPTVLSHDEAQRVSAVRRYDVVDGAAADETFDRVAALAARLLRAPMAQVSVLDAERNHVRGAAGLPKSYAVERTDAFCAAPVAAGEPVAIEDVRSDARVAGNTLLARQPSIRSYAGAPLVTSEGFSIGAISVFDTRPRAFAQQELADLADLAALVMRGLELRLAAGASAPTRHHRFP
ncbi:serine/threonine-protein kinase [Amnibacterium sp.]|uniref:serine/threonine-protein kinase n=1 Tax=Amnibacterium sp. TaxID=1872496 RepID=UPI00262C313A|nr:serine/threonine-protein kinase [Amnibacterium sp.]MCU1473685.1 serine/threonine protein kinase [Amnibacterium sp.]